MNREKQIWIAMATLFFGIILLVSRMSDNKPYSSYSTKPEGTKAAYLLLKNLGFQTKRNTQKNWNGNGVLIALGNQYLVDSSGVITLPEDYRFTNEFIRENAVVFIEQLWPYHNSIIVFQEYGRSLYHHSSHLREEMTLWSILPAWMHLILLGGGLIAFFLMFFYKQRLGKPLPAEGFFCRPPLESVYAMATALEKASVYKDCADYYYRYYAQRGTQWDKEGYLATGVGGLSNERAACNLMAQIDQRIKEYQHEGK